MLPQILKRAIADTPLDDAVRHFHTWLKEEPLTANEKKNIVYDKQTVEVMRKVLSPDSNCVDVGCHGGAILREMIKVAPAGTHYGFEPIPELYQSLVTQFPNAKIFNYALSDTNGSASFNYVLSAPSYSGLQRREYKTNNEIVEQITVETRTLDSVAEHPIHFIKIDVEGGEMGVLQGAVETIKRYRPTIVFEHGLGAADYYGTSPPHLYALLIHCGLQVFLMKDWLRGKPALGVSDFCGHFQDRDEFYFMAHRDYTESKNSLHR
jgi:FkbM family methyltransferase